MPAQHVHCLYLITKPHVKILHFGSRNNADRFTIFYDYDSHDAFSQVYNYVIHSLGGGQKSGLQLSIACRVLTLKKAQLLMLS